MLVYIAHPKFPLAHAFLDFWSTIDTKIYGKIPESTKALQQNKLANISNHILHELAFRASKSIPSPYVKQP